MSVRFAFNMICSQIWAAIAVATSGWQSMFSCLMAAGWLVTALIIWYRDEE